MSASSGITITCSSNNLEVPTVELHHLPCKVKVDEVANVKSYFIPNHDEKNGRKSLQATFRGRLLDGKTINVPENYCGYVLAEKKKPFSEDENRTFEISGKFENFTQWYLDSQYSSDNVTARACSTWPGQLAEAIHKHVVLEN